MSSIPLPPVTEEYKAFTALGAASPDLKAPLTVPTVTATSYLTRLDGESDGAYNTRVAIDTYETEFNTVVNGELEWGTAFFKDNGSIYYYKPYLQQILAADAANLTADQNNADRQVSVQAVQSFLGISIPTNATSLTAIRAIIDSNPPGMPPFVTETEHFYQFTDVLATPITIDDIDRSLLDLIQSTFTGTYSVYYSDLSTGLYKNGDTLYFGKLVEWSTSPSQKLGIFLYPTANTTKYPTASTTAYFFPFAPLSETEQAFVQQFKSLVTDYSDITIVDL
jgi:hypothetical protein